MRDYTRIDSYLNILAGDIYSQPDSEGHSALAKSIIDTWMSRMTSCRSVLDLGCGTGFCQPFFETWNIQYEGVCLGEDYIVSKEKGRNVKKMDFHFLEHEDQSFDLLWSRHSWEHSPMPLLALMEWHRVSRQWLGLIVPAPEYWTVAGVNHYNVLYKEQIEVLLKRAGWKIMWDEVNYAVKDVTDENPQGITVANEYWLMCEKS